MESGATSDGQARVCPRCGHEAGEDPYCSECGLHLAELDELPTHADWSADPASVAEAAGAKESTQPLKARIEQLGSRKAWVALALVAVLAVGGAGVALALSGPDEQEASWGNAEPETELDASSTCADWLEATSSERGDFAAGPGTDAMLALGTPPGAYPPEALIEVIDAQCSEVEFDPSVVDLRLDEAVARLTESQAVNEYGCPPDAPYPQSSLPGHCASQP